MRALCSRLQSLRISCGCKETEKFPSRRIDVILLKITSLVNYNLLKFTIGGLRYDLPTISVMPERLNRSVGLDKEDWEFLIESGSKSDRGPAAELRHLLKWAIEQKKKGLIPEKPGEDTKKVFLAEFREEFVSLVREELTKYGFPTNVHPPDKGRTQHKRK